MKSLHMKSLVIFLSLLFYNSIIFALIEPRPLPSDHRLRIINYKPNDVFKFTGYYDYQASIELSPEEEIIRISMGDTTSWQIVPAGYRIFIKPIEPDAKTNMTLITNKRTYFFELHAAETLDIRDPEMVFNVKFIYDDEDNDNSHITYTSNFTGNAPDLSHPEKYNFGYSVSGHEEIAPIKIFDDGVFTYLQFRDKNAEIPAVFAVDEALREAMVNYRLDQNNPDMIILEQVFEKLAIRKGKKVACVFNEGFRAY